MKRQQFADRPAMVGDPRCHGRCPVDRSRASRLGSQAETRVIRAKVIDRTDQVHPVLQRQGLAGQRPAPARQRCEAFPKRCVEPLNVCCIDHPVPLRSASERFHACRRAIDNAALRLDHAPPLVALDHLGEQDMAPRTQPWPSTRARACRIAKGLANRPDIGAQPIGTEQQRTLRGTAPHPLDQPPDQRHVTLLADLAAQPHACLDHHGQRHPHDAALFLDAEFIGLHLLQVPWSFDQELLHCLPLATGACPPIRDGALVKPKSRHDCLQGTPMSEQGHYEHHGLCRGAQPIEDGTFAGAEGFVTRVAEEALLLLRMDTDIAHTSLASGMAMLIGAEYGRGVHDAPPGYAWKHDHEKYVWTPFALQLHRTTVRCGAIACGREALHKPAYPKLRKCFSVQRETGRQEVQELAGLMTTAANKNPGYGSYPYTRHDREIRPQSRRPRSVGPAPLSG